MVAPRSPRAKESESWGPRAALLVATPGHRRREMVRLLPAPRYRAYSGPYVPVGARASLRDVPGGRREPRQGGTSGRAVEAESGGGRPSRGRWLQREDDPWPPAASDDFRAARRWSGPSPQPGILGAAPREAWLDSGEVPRAPGQACSCPEWSAGEESATGGNGSGSVSSGRLSGSSGGHELRTPPPGLWKERPPQGPPRQPRQSDPRLERLRDKIRAQAEWQASCSSLGTSAPSNASRLCKGPRPVPQKKVRKVARVPATQACPGFRVLRDAESQMEDKASVRQRREPARLSRRQASVPREATERTEGCSCKREKAPKSCPPRRAPQSKDSEVGVHAWRRGQALVRLLLGPRPVLPGRQSRAPLREPEPAPTLELGDSKKVLAVAGGPASPRTPSPACSDQQVSVHTPSPSSGDQPATIQTAMAILRDLRRQIQAGLDLARHPQARQGPELGQSKLEGQDSTERRQQGAFSQRPWATTQDQGSAPERAWTIPGPCSASAGCGSHPQRAWVAEEWDPSFQRPESPPARLGSSPPRPWSSTAGQDCEDWRATVRGPWEPPERPYPAHRPRSTSFVHRAGAPCKGGGSGPPRREGSIPRAPGKENAEELAAGHRPRGVPGPPHSPESLRAFMRHRAQARRRQALQEKAAAAQAQELRSRRLQEVYRKQREAAIGRPARVVSQSSPGIVTFVPHCAPRGGLDTPGSVGPPVLEWSKVTSGMVLGDQEAPGSFCLCLNKAFTRDKTGEMEDSSSPLLSADASLRPWKLQDPPTSYLPPQLCIFLDPEEATGLGVARPLHFQHKQAQLQALETTANVLKRRIDMLTRKLHKSEAPNGPRDLGPGPPPPLLPSTEPAPVWPTALVPSGEAGACLSSPCLPVTEALPWRSGQESWHRASPWDQRTSSLQGLTGYRPSTVEQRLPRAAGSFRPESAFAGSSHGVPATPDPPCSSLQLEELLAARRVGSEKPWTTQTCGCENPEGRDHVWFSSWLQALEQHLMGGHRVPGGQEPGGPCLGELQGNHLTDIWQKSLSFLESLKLDQQKQAGALALLRQRAEREVIETQVALDRLFFRPQMQQLPKARPEMTSELEQPQVRGAPELQSASAVSLQETGRPDRTLSHMPLRRLDPWHNWRIQDSTDQGFELQMLEQSLREEELRAQHQAALLRLREMALEEKVRAELAWLEHQRGGLGAGRDEGALAALEEQQQRVLGDLRQEQKQIEYLRRLHLSAHRQRRLILQHQRDLASVQRCTARLQQELRAQTTRSQSLGPKTSLQAPGWTQASSCPPTPHRPSSPSDLSSPRSPQSSSSTHLLDECAVTPLQAPAAAGGHLPPPRPVWRQGTAAADWPGSPDQLVESQGDTQTKPSPKSAEERAWTPTGSSAQGRRQPSPAGDGPFGPQEASQVAGGSSSREGSALDLHVTGSPLEELEEPCEMKPGQSEGQRIETCWPEDPGVPSAQMEAAQLDTPPGGGLIGTCFPSTACPSHAHRAQSACPSRTHRAQFSGNSGPPGQGPGAPQLEVPPEASSLPGLTAPLHEGSESAPGTCSGLSPASSQSSVSGASLQEFQKASAVRVNVSESSASLPDLETEVPPDSSLSWASWEAPGSPSSGLHPEPRVSGAPGGRGLQGSRPGPWHSVSVEAGSPEPSGGWPWSLPDASRPRSGSGLSEASSQGWGEDNEEDLAGHSPGAELASGCPSPAEGPSDLGDSDSVGGAPPSLCAGEAQKASGAISSLTSGSNQDNTTGRSHKAAHTASPRHTSPASDLDLSLALSSGTSASEGADFSREGETRPSASAGCAQQPPDTAVALSSPPGHPKSRASGPGDSGAPAAPAEARPRRVGGVLTEILSPVDEVLSYGSADLPSSTLRDASLPSWPLEQALPADKDGSVCSGLFPTPPEEALHPGASPSPPEEDTSIATDELSSWPEDSSLEALSPEPRGPGHPQGAGPAQSLEEELQKWSCVAEQQAGGGQRPTCRRAYDAPAGLLQLCPQLPPSITGGDPERVVRVPSDPPRGHGAPAVGMGSWAGTVLAGPSAHQDVSWGGVLCSMSTEGRGDPVGPLAGLGKQLDATLAKASAAAQDPREVMSGGRGAAVPPHSPPAALAAPSPGGGPLGAGAHGCAGDQGVGGLGHWEEDQSWARDSESREPLPGRDVDGSPSPGAGLGRDEVMGMLSTQLTRRILRDSLATLSELAQQGSPLLGKSLLD